MAHSASYSLIYRNTVLLCCLYSLLYSYLGYGAYLWFNLFRSTSMLSIQLSNDIVMYKPLSSFLRLFYVFYVFSTHNLCLQPNCTGVMVISLRELLHSALSLHLHYLFDFAKISIGFHLHKLVQAVH